MQHNATKAVGTMKKKTTRKLPRQRPTVSVEFASLGKEYSKAVGSYCAWSLDLDLGPVGNLSSAAEEDKFMLDYYNSLQYTLYETGYPETVDRTDEPRVVSNKEVAVTVLSSPVECMSILLEGGRQSPGNILLVLSLTWVSKVKSEKIEFLYSLLVHKAITFNANGHTYLETFDPPRRATYLVNFFTHACTGGQRRDGESLEAGLDCPMSSSLRLVQLTDDKIWTRCIMARSGMAYPATLAFVFRSDLEYRIDNTKIQIVKLEEVTDQRNCIIQELTKFLKLPYIANRKQVVVKPSGIRFHGSLGVSYHSVNDSESITRAVLALFPDLQPGDAVMVETFCKTLSPRQASESYDSWHAREGLGFRIRATVCRAPGDIAICTDITCGISDIRQPICGDNTAPQTLETTLQAYGLKADDIQTVKSCIETKSEAVLANMIQQEGQMSQYERGEYGAYTDIIALDLVLTDVNDVITPVGIEVNSHDCTINCQLMEFMNPERQGGSVRPLVQTMISRSQLGMMYDKKVLVIGAGSHRKQRMWEDVRNKNIHVILVNDSFDHPAREHVHHFIYYNFTDHTLDCRHAEEIVSILKTERIHVDGCLSFWEDCGPLAATVCDLLALSGAGLEGVSIATSVTLTQTILRSRTGDIPHWPRTYLYTVASHLLSQPEHLDTIPDSLTFPATLRPDYVFSTTKPVMVSDIQEVTKAYRKSAEDAVPSHCNDTASHRTKMLIMEYTRGSDHEVDVILFKRKMVTTFVSDISSSSVCVSSVMPSDKKAQLTCAAYQCCTELGLTDGVFSVKLKMCPTGPKLMNIYTTPYRCCGRKWIREKNKVDVMLWAMMIACDIRPYFHKVDLPSRNKTDIITEVSSQECTISCQPDRQGQSVRSLLQTIDSRTLLDSMYHKKILAIGAGGYSKRELWPDARAAGIHVILVDDHIDHPAREQVYRFIYYNFTDHTLDCRHAEDIVSILKTERIHVDGCLSFWEDCGPLAAAVCDLLALNGVGLEGARNAKSKTRTQTVLQELPNSPAFIYSTPVHPLRDTTDLDLIPPSFTFPALLKSEFGSSAVGTMLVKNRQEVREKYHYFTSMFRDERDYHGVGLGHGNQMLLMPWIDGTEHDVDIIIFQRKMVAAFVSDNGPTRGLSMYETAACMPSVLSADKQEELVMAAYHCCIEIGLFNGVFNVELKMTPTGPKLLEINGRMGGFYLRRWVQAVYNVDLMLCAMTIACGERPEVPNISPTVQLAGIMCIPSLHRHILEEPDTINTVRRLADQDEIMFIQMEESVPDVIYGQEEPMASITVASKNIREARMKLIAVSKLLRVDSAEYPVETFADFT